MITTAEIQSIDYNSNSCTVRLPLFENVNSEFPAIVVAKFVSLPGIFNGYDAGDIVWVAFNNDWYSQPVILGKVYQGIAAENETDDRGELKIKGGTVHCADLVVSNKATLPVDTKIAGVEADYNSLQKIITQLKNLNLYGTTGVGDTSGNGRVTPKVEEGVLVGLEIDGVYYKLPDGSEDIDGGNARTSPEEYSPIPYDGGNASTWGDSGGSGGTVIPLPPDTNGRYRLECEVADGIIVYTWVPIE